MKQVESQNSDTSKYAIYVRFAAIAATSTALILVALKIYAWFVTGASAMLASATDSMLDLFASLANVFILRLALAPADEDHKFGHGKAESIAGLVQSAFVLGSALLLLFHGVERLQNPKVIEQSEVGIWVSIIAVVLTLGLVVIQKWVINKTSSVAISADSLHYQSDLILNLGVLVAIILSQGIWVYADGLFTIGVGIFLIVGASKIVWLSIDHLMDKELEEEKLELIRQTVLSHPKALGIHELRTRQAGQHTFIQFHLVLDDLLSLYDAHAIADDVEASLQELFSDCEIFIHQDPKSVVPRELEDKENF